MSRLRLTTVAMSVVTGPVTTPKRAPSRAKYATLALQISFLLGRQAMLGQEPPIQRRSTTAVRRPARARFQASSLPAAPLPRIRISYRSRSGILISFVCRCSSRLGSHRGRAHRLAQPIESGQQEPLDDLGPGVAPGRGAGFAADRPRLAGVGLESAEEAHELARFRRLEDERVVTRHDVVFARHPRACDSPCRHRFETHEA